MDKLVEYFCRVAHARTEVLGHEQGSGRETEDERMRKRSRSRSRLKPRLRQELMSRRRS